MAHGGWSEILRNFTILNCDLYNSSYMLNFNYTNGKQDIVVARTDITTDSTLLPLTGSQLPRGTDQTWNCTTDDPLETTSGCFSTIHAKMLSYQAVNDAFMLRLIGDIGFAGYVGTSAVPGTVLSDTEELSFINDPLIAGSAWDTQAFVDRKDNARGSRGPLIQTLESLFENITVSMLSDPYLQ